MRMNFMKNTTFKWKEAKESALNSFNSLNMNDRGWLGHTTKLYSKVERASEKYIIYLQYYHSLLLLIILIFVVISNQLIYCYLRTIISIKNYNLNSNFENMLAFLFLWEFSVYLFTESAYINHIIINHVVMVSLNRWIFLYKNNSCMFL